LAGKVELSGTSIQEGAGKKLRYFPVEILQEMLTVERVAWEDKVQILPMSTQNIAKARFA
jgi:hypothetical protein